MWNNRFPKLPSSDWRVGIIALLVWLAWNFCLADMLGFA